MIIKMMVIVMIIIIATAITIGHEHEHRTVWGSMGGKKGKRIPRE
jgi:hypothetical protein